MRRPAASFSIILVLALIALLTTACAERKATTAKQETLGEWLNAENGGDGAQTKEQFVYLAERDLSQGKPESAFINLGKALALDPKDVTIRLRKADLLLGQKSFEDAYREYKTVLETAPDNARAHAGLGEILLKSGQTAEARKHLMASLAADPNQWLVQAHLGVVASYENDYPGAMAAYREALRLSPNQPDVLNNLGVACLMGGDNESAVQYFHQALRAGLAKSKTYNNLGLALARQGRYNEALEAFRYGGDEARAYNNLGYILYLSGRYAQAIGCFERALELSPAFYVQAGENLKRARMAAKLDFASAALPDFAPAPEVPGASLAPARQAAPLALPAAPTAMPAPGPLAGPGPAASPAAKPISEFRPAPVTAAPVPAMAQAALAPAPLLRTDLPPLEGGPLAEANRLTTANTPRKDVSTPAPAAPGADAASTYTIMLSTWRTLDKATAQSAKLNAAGHQTFVVRSEQSSGSWYRVLLGRFGSLREASAALEPVRSSLKIADATVIRVREDALQAATAGATAATGNL